MLIRRANLKDFENLYCIAKKIPEIKVSATEPFMDEDEFKYCFQNKNGIFLVAEENDKILGFIYADAKDSDRPFSNKYGCIVYIAVLPQFRKMEVATKLYVECVKEMKKFGITHLFCWANTEGDGAVVKFMKKHGFEEGHKFVWMDKKI